MYSYRPPKSAIWGHRLGRLTTRQIQDLVRRFLTTATGDHEFTSGVLLADLTSPDGLLAQQLLAIAGERPTNITAEATDRCIATLAEWEDSSQRHPEFVDLLQGCNIREWRIRGRLVPTNSALHIHYGMLPCLSTFLQFDSIGSFEFIQQTLADLRLCTLNPKHLRPVRTSADRAGQPLSDDTG